MTEEADERLLGRVSARGIRVTDLSLVALARKVVANLMQDLAKERAMLMKTHPQFKAFERAMVRPGRKHRIADQPFDNEIVANLGTVHQSQETALQIDRVHPGGNAPYVAV